MKKIIVVTMLSMVLFSCKKESYDPDANVKTSHWYQLKSNSQDTLFSFYIPNCFTPNNDNINDSFCPQGYFTGSKYQFSVFSRNGNRIFYTDDKNGKWDGHVSASGNVTNGGIYQFSVILTDSLETEYRFEGAVMLYE